MYESMTVTIGLDVHAGSVQLAAGRGAEVREGRAPAPRAARGRALGADRRPLGGARARSRSAACPRGRPHRAHARPPAAGLVPAAPRPSPTDAVLGGHAAALALSAEASPPG